MSFVALLEIMVDISQFQNVDLLNQGIYQMRVQLQSETEAVIQPYLIVETEKATIQQKYTSHLHTKNLQEQGTFDDCYFYSKRFSINYCEQIVDLDDICVFRVQYKSDTQNSISPIINLRIGLLYNDSEKQQDTEVSTSTWMIRDASQGFSEFIPVIFGEQSLSSCKVYIHTIQRSNILLIKKVYKFEAQISQVSVIAEFDTYLSQATKQFDSILLQKFISNYVEGLREIQKIYQNKLLSLQNHMPKEQKQLFLTNMLKFQTKINTKINNLNQNQISDNLYQLNIEVETSLFLIWNLFIDTYRTYKTLINQQIPETKQQSLQQLVLQDIKYSDFAECQQDDFNSSRTESSKYIRENAKDFFQNLVEDYTLITNPERFPILYATLFKQNDKLTQIQISEIQTKNQAKHLVVFVHGYQGSSFDFRLWKSHFFIKYPYFTYLCSAINEDDTDIDIWTMGINLAKEIKNYIQDRMLYQQAFRLSIIGHSLGGLIARVAILHLDQYQSNLHTFVSLASPHLGLGAQHNKLVGTGLWILKQINKGCKSLDQLTMSDSPQLSSTLIWKLSQNSKLNLFKNVLIVYSYQDLYVPYHSAEYEQIRVNKSIDSFYERKCSNHNKLIQNLMGSLTNDKLIKIDVSFPILKKSIDSMIGRTAHIQFLDNSLFIRIFIETHNQYFA